MNRTVPKFAFATFALLGLGHCQVFPRQTSYANTSFATSTLSPSPTLSSTTSPIPRVPGSANESCPISSICYVCGDVFIDFIGLNSWYSKNYEVTVATVVQQYIQYNNTVVPANSSTTLPGANATAVYGRYDPFTTPTVDITGIASTLAPGDGGAITSPSAWAAARDRLSISFSAMQGPYVTYSSQFLTYALPSAVYASVSIPDGGWSGTVNAPVPTALKDAIIQALPATLPDDVGFELPLSLCTGTWQMGGEPTVHIPVSAVTVTSSSTSTTNAVLLNPTTSKPTTSPGEETTSPGEKTTSPQTTVFNEQTTTPSEETTKPSQQTMTTKETQTSPSATKDATISTPTTRGPQSQTPDSAGSTPKTTAATQSDSAALPSPGADQPAVTQISRSSSKDATPATSANPADAIVSLVVAPTSTADQTQNTFSQSVSSGTRVVTGSVTSPIAASTAQQAQPTAFTIASATISQNSASQLVVGTQTLVAGGSTVTQNGNTLSLAASGTAVVVNGVTSAITPAQTIVAPTPSPAITVGSSTVSEASNSNFVIGSQTLSAGGSAVTVGGTTLSLASAGDSVVINGKTSAIATPVSAPMTLGTESGAVATPLASSAYLLPDGQTLSGGSSLVVSGTTFVNSPSGALSVNGVPVASLTSENAAAAPGVSQGSASALVICGSTLLSGQSAVIFGTTYALSATGNDALVNGVPTTLPTASPGSPITLGNIVATPTIVPDAAVSGSTLLPGSALTVGGSTYSIASSGSAFIVNGQTVSGTQDNITLNGSPAAVTPTLVQGTTAFVISGSILLPGSAITVDEQTLSIAPSGGVIRVESGGTTSSDALAGAIVSGLGGSVASSGAVATASATMTSLSASVSVSVAAAAASSSAGVQKVIVGNGLGVGAFVVLIAWM